MSPPRAAAWALLLALSGQRSVQGWAPGRPDAVSLLQRAAEAAVGHSDPKARAAQLSQTAGHEFPPAPAAGAEGSPSAGAPLMMWPTGRGAVGRYGWSSALRAPFDLKLAWSWHHPKGRFHTLTYGTAVDGQGNIFLSAADAIRKFSPAGELLWEHTTLPAEMPDAAALFDGAVYSKDTHGRVFALSMDTGKELWSTKVCDGISQDNGFVTVHGGVVLVATDMRKDRNFVVRGMNATNGAPLWTFGPDVNVWNFMASFPGDGTALFQDQSGQAYRLRVSDGQLLWKGGGFTGSWTDGTATLGSDGLFYTVYNNEPNNVTQGVGPDSQGTLCAHSVADGSEVWRATTPRPPNNAPAVGRVYGYPGYTVVQPMGQQVLQGAPTDVYAYDAATGRQRWVFRGPRQSGKLQAGDGEGMFERLTSGLRAMCLPNPWSAPTIDAGGTVFVGNQDGKFFALRDLNGDGVVEGPGEVSSFETHAAFSGSAGPSLSPGRVAVASCDSLFVFDE